MYEKVKENLDVDRCCSASVFFQSYRLYILVQGPSSYSDTTYFYSELLAHINPLLNPLVYVVFNKQYRASIKELFVKCRCKNTCCRFGEKFYLTGKRNFYKKINDLDNFLSDCASSAVH